jgi:chorismate synthase
MSGNWGRNLRLSIFGESHGAGIGMVIDGLPAGLPVDEGQIATEMARRAPGKDPAATARKEADKVRLLSGVYNGKTTGTPICGLIENTNTRGEDYGNIQTLARPGHADYTGFVRYGGFNDIRGGGHFSGRLTAPLVFAGALARAFLAREGVEAAAHILSIEDVRERPFRAEDLTGNKLKKLREMSFPVLEEREEAMRQRIRQAKEEQDSVGGVIECAAVGCPAGWGSPFFDSVESRAASLLFSVPAVKGVEFGAGFEIAAMRGSAANDALCLEKGQVRTKTNRNGGINGGITNGMPIIVRAAVKPTPSIARPQQTIDYRALEPAEIQVQGRHDPCIVLRAVPVIEAALLLALTECALEIKK